MSIGLNPKPGYQRRQQSFATVSPANAKPVNCPVVRPPQTRPGFFTGALTARELRRRFWHMAPGISAYALHFVSHRDPISPTLQGILVGCCVVIGLKILLSFRSIQRSNEASGTAAVAGYSLSVLLTVLLFPRHLELGLSVLTILALGDGSATLFGLMLRGPKLPWNRDKSVSGLLAFITVGILSTAWMYHGETLNAEGIDPQVSFPVAVLLVGPAVVAAAFAESVASRINDNIRVGAVSAITLVATHMLFVW